MAVLMPRFAHSRSWRLATLLVLGTLCCLYLLGQLRDNARASLHRQVLSDPLDRPLSPDAGRNASSLYPNTIIRPGSQGLHTHWDFGSPCDKFPATDDIALVMKTGTTEIYDKLPTQLLTSVQCIPDVIIFSDLEAQVGKYHVYNALDQVSDSVKSVKSEFELYEAQRTCHVSQKECTTGRKGGWDLDKYKFLHIIERLWELRPGRKWYVFAEADTYVFWPNLVHWLHNFADSETEFYAGSAAWYGDIPFGHGGSGYVMSGKLVDKLRTIPNLAAKYDELAMDSCCGDALLAAAAHEVGCRLKNLNPHFNGEHVRSMAFGELWCEPIFTMHHLWAEDVSALWQFERTRKKQGLVLLKDVYDALAAPHMVPMRKEWENLSQDVCLVGPDERSQGSLQELERNVKPEGEKNWVERAAHQSPEACALACTAAGLNLDEQALAQARTPAEREVIAQDALRRRQADAPDGGAGLKKNRDCFQWSHHPGVCCLGRSFKIGRFARQSDLGFMWTGGWMMGRINDWVEAAGECEAPKWKTEWD